MKLGLLVVLWILWCFLHSFLISDGVSAFLQKLRPRLTRYYRLLYNVVALATLAPVLIYSSSVKGPALFSWTGWLRIPQGLLLASALILFAAGARRYDAQSFLGLRQIRGAADCAGLTNDCGLDTSGILAWVRHPWYSGGMLIVWSRPLNAAAIWTNLVLTGYFIVGAFLEERKLEKRFAREYADYRRQVPMFFPLRRLGQLLRRRDRGSSGRLL